MSQGKSLNVIIVQDFLVEDQAPLSPWYVSKTFRTGGLLLNVAAAPVQSIPSACEHLFALKTSCHTTASLSHTRRGPSAWSTRGATKNR